MNILFIGSMLPEKYGTKLEYLSLAGNHYQNLFVNTLKKLGYSVQCISYIGFPVEVNYQQEVSALENVVYHPNKKEALKRFRRRWKQEVQTADIVICYNVIYAWMGLNKFAKRHGVKTVLLLADFSAPDSFHNKLMQVKALAELHEIKKYDLVVGLSEQTREYCKKQQKFLCIEGGIQWEDYENVNAPSYQSDYGLTIMYSGLLSHVTGVDLLLDAIQIYTNSQNKNNMRVKWIFSGKGPLSQQVQDFADEYDNVQYIGSVPYEDYLAKLSQANIYINPRNMNLPENQNNFPSKIMEYLAMGRLIVSTRFIGWEKFEKNLYLCDTDAHALAKAIQQAVDEYEINSQRIYELNREKAKEYIWDNNIHKILENI